MPTKAVFTMKLESDLRDSFMAEAAAADRPASQVVRELMRNYIEQRRHERAYSEYLARKVDKARTSMLNGQGRSHGAVEADFAAKRAKLMEGSA
ncbi:antitoxin of toxin-antitoxin stability system [Ponticaulis profundi]|uniref:Antitoxin of toxin-antitoxin stability system n=1 Tax=Ponticaulis profundi TaxID=2665222 RepID=A0ABW1S8C7_9PROT